MQRGERANCNYICCDLAALQVPFEVFEQRRGCSEHSRLFLPQFHMISQMALLMDKSRSAGTSEHQNRNSTYNQGSQNGRSLPRSENDLINTGTRGTAKPRPKALPSWCLH